MLNQNLPSIELKRVVACKCIVTEQFKLQLISDLNRAKTILQNDILFIEARATTIINDFMSRNDTNRAGEVQHQLLLKKEEYDIKLNDLMVKIEEAKSLPLNSEFVQGTLEGPVKVTIGDNLYQKVGASEVVVLDGVIVEIRNSECDHTNIFSYN